jgi:translation initiation factor IF-1
MPGSKKGRLSGGARKEINDRRSAEAVKSALVGTLEGIVFGRVTKMLGANHVSVRIDSEHGGKELRARIPNIFSRRGATPITTRDVVGIEVGGEFDVDTAIIRPSDLFDVKMILTPKQVYKLQQDGVIPSWMSHEAALATKKDDDDGAYDFDYSEKKGDEDEEQDSTDEEQSKTADFSRKNAKIAALHDDDFDIDDI